MPPIAWTQLQSRDRYNRGMRREAGMGNGLRRYLEGIQTDLGKVGSFLFERNPRARKPDERKHRDLDLEKAEAEVAAANGSSCRRNLHRQVRL